MHKRKCGKNGPELSVLGMGTWAAGGAWQFGYGPADDAEMLRTLHYGIDAGINWIDTAPAYGLGHAESLVGRAIKDRRDRVYIATKCGLLWNKHGKVRKELSPQTIRDEVEASLRRLQTDVIDLYQIHWPDPARSMQTAWHTMAKLQKEGKVRWIGLSNFNTNLVRDLNSLHSVQSCQDKYNLINRQAEKELLPFCQQQDIGVLVYSPLHSGLLSQNFDAAALQPNDWRKRHPAFNSPALDENIRLLHKLAPIAEIYGKTISQLACNWVLQNPAVTSAIVGIRSVEKLQQILKAADFHISQQHMQEIDKFTSNLSQAQEHH